MAPDFGVFGEGLGNGAGDILVFLGDLADVQLFDEASVAFLLAGDHLVDNHGATGRDSLLLGGAARFGDDEMVRGHQAGHLIGPAQNFDAVAMFRGALEKFFPKFGVATGGDGQFDVWNFEEAIHSLACFFPTGVDEVKEFKRSRGIGGERRREVHLGENGIDREADGLDFSGGDAVVAQDLGGFIVGHAVEIAGGAEPRGIDGDGISDDGDKAEGAFGVIFIDFLDGVGVNGIGGDDAIGIGLLQHLFERALEAANGHDGIEAAVVHHGVDAIPDGGGVAGQAEIGFLEDVVEEAEMALKKVEGLDFDFARSQFEGVGDVAGGGVMAIAETSGEDKDLFHRLNLACQYDE